MKLAVVFTLLQVPEILHTLHGLGPCAQAQSCTQPAHWVHPRALPWLYCNKSMPDKTALP